MDCEEARQRMTEAKHGRLSSAARADLDGHVRSCDACQHEEAVDAVLSDALEKMTAEPPPSAKNVGMGGAPASGPQLPPASSRVISGASSFGTFGLGSAPFARGHGQVVRKVSDADRSARDNPRRRLFLGFLAIMGLAVIVATFPRGYERADSMVNEAVNDHVRVRAASHPVEVPGVNAEAVGSELAKKLDFAPIGVFEGDSDLALAGGSLAYFIDRKAAAFVYQKPEAHEGTATPAPPASFAAPANGSHSMTLFVFRAEGLPWRNDGQRSTLSARGFNVVLFRRGDLGYAAVSDVNEATLTRIIK